MEPRQPSRAVKTISTGESNVSDAITSTGSLNETGSESGSGSYVLNKTTTGYARHQRQRWCRWRIDRERLGGHEFDRY